VRLKNRMNHQRIFFFCRQKTITAAATLGGKKKPR
jgi:hypothetical protein